MPNLSNLVSITLVISMNHSVTPLMLYHQSKLTSDGQFRGTGGELDEESLLLGIERRQDLEEEPDRLGVQRVTVVHPAAFSEIPRAPRFEVVSAKEHIHLGVYVFKCWNFKSRSMIAVN